MTENKYDGGKIYKIISNETDKCYVGSTIEVVLARRMSKHRSDFKKGNYLSSSEILKFPDAKIILLEAYSCKSRDELTKREQFWIDQLDCVNKVSACGVDKNRKNQKVALYYQNHKEKRDAQIKLWDQKNRVKRNAQKRELYRLKKLEKKNIELV